MAFCVKMPVGLIRSSEFVEFDFTKGAGYLYSNEWPFYVFDAVLIFVSPLL